MKAIQMMELYNMMNDTKHILMADLRKLEFLRKNKQEEVFAFRIIFNLLYLILRNIMQMHIKMKRNIILREFEEQFLQMMSIQRSNKMFNQQKIQQIRDFWTNILFIQYLKQFDKIMKIQITRKIMRKYSLLILNSLNNLKIINYFQGSNLNANSKKQLDALQIKTIIDFKNYEANAKISEWKKEEFKYINYPINESGEELIDFSEITNIIDFQNSPKLLCCPGIIKKY
ncbi:unnamed protein product [Paramecium sonneborni]|uniref:Uncharacterized protein n=1 Tax=Paramecium sonneborni TaxID=65129 RepID=A0A8S1Q4Q1_9CILI|nr:unnamed protein product [Paramecium sonneborni]